jgi:hypothetical protein
MSFLSTEARGYGFSIANKSTDFIYQNSGQDIFAIAEAGVAFIKRSHLNLYYL